MLVRFALVAAVLCAACGNESKAKARTDEAPPIAAAEAAPSSPAMAAPAPDETTCGDGKITADFTSPRAGLHVVLYCRDGKPYVQKFGSTPDTESKKVAKPTTMAVWQEIWRLADAAGWKDASGFCTVGGVLTTELTVARDKVKRTLSCDGDLTPAFERVADAMRAEADKLEDTLPPLSEAQTGMNEGEDTASEVTGVWQACPQKGAVGCAARAFDADGSYGQHRAGTECGSNDRASVYGTWTRRDGGLEIVEELRLQTRGGKTGATGCTGGTDAIVEISPPAKRVVTVRACSSEAPKSSYPCLQFDGKPYWRSSIDPINLASMTRYDGQDNAVP